MKRYTGIALFFAAIALAQTPTVIDGGVLNAASFAKDSSGKGSPVAPGSLVVIFGSNLGSTLASADSVPFSTSLGGVSVTFNGIDARMKDVVPAASIVNVQMPSGVLAPGQPSATVNVVVKVNGVSSDPRAVPIVPIAPGVFSIPPGVGNGVLVFVDAEDNNKVKIAAPAAASGTIGYPTGPIRRGATAFFYATGLGAMTPPVPDGAASPVGVANVTPVVLIGGITAQVQFAGQAPGFPGVNQINIVIPQGAQTGNAVPLQIQSGGITSTDKVTVAIQ